MAKYYKRRGDSQPKFYRQSDAPGLFMQEFAHFENFFYKKTGVPWEQRLVVATKDAVGGGPDPRPDPTMAAGGKAMFRYDPPVRAPD